MRASKPTFSESGLDPSEGWTPQALAVEWWWLEMAMTRYLETTLQRQEPEAQR